MGFLCSLAGVILPTPGEVCPSPIARCIQRFRLQKAGYMKFQVGYNSGKRWTFERMFDELYFDGLAAGVRVEVFYE